MAEPVEDKSFGDNRVTDDERAGRSVEPSQSAIASSEQEIVPTDALDSASENTSVEVMGEAADLPTHLASPGESALHGQSTDPVTDDRQLQWLKEEARSLWLQLDSTRAKLAETTTEIRRLEARLTEDAEDRKEIARKLKIAQRDARKLKNMLVQQGEEIERLQEQTAKLRKKNRSIKDTLKTAEAELEVEKRAGRSMKRLIHRLESRVCGYQQVDLALKWLGQGLGTEASLFPRLLATIGSDSFAANDLDSHLVYRGYDLIWPGDGEDNEDVEVLIVGRTGWDEERLEKQLAAREGHDLRVYSQEMFLLCLATNRDILEELSESELNAIAADHPALKFLAESELEWPGRLVPSLPTEFRPFDADSRADESPLHVMGYAVGKTNGRPGPERRRLLSHAFESDIPWVDSDQYMRDWGRPRTRRRLWRISNHLGWLARSWKRFPSHRVAVEDWVSDLSHLKKSYYRPWMRFRWPEVRVPGGSHNHDRL